MKQLKASILGLLLTGQLCAVCAFAAPDIEVLVETDFEPTQALGLIVSEKGTTTKPGAKFTKLEGTKYLVSFPLSAAELKSGGTVTAMLGDAQGHNAFGDVREISKEGLRPALVGMSECKEQGNLPSTVQGQLALLESLVGVRSQRREVLQEAIKSELSGELLERLQRLEEGFGLRGVTELSAELQPYALVERLSAILSAIRNVQVNKARRDAELRQTVAAPPPPEEPAEPAAE